MIKQLRIAAMYGLFAGAIGSIALVMFGGMNEFEFDLAFKIIGMLAIGYFTLREAIKVEK